MSAALLFEWRRAREHPRRASRLREKRFALASMAAFLCCWVGVATAQTVQVQLPPLPHYVGDAIDLRIVAEGFSEDPTPTVEAPDAGNAELEYLGVSPNISTTISINGGRIRRSKEVQFVFSYRFRAAQPGSTVLGPFTVAQGAIRRVTRPAHLDVRPIPTNDRLGVQLILPDAPVFLGERVPVTVRFSLRGSLRTNLHRYTLRVPFFDLTDSFRFLEAPDSGDTEVTIETAAGGLKLKGNAQVVDRDGEEVLVVSVMRIAVPLRDGALEVPPAVLDVEEGTNFRRDLFGGRQPTQVRKWRATDRKQHFAVDRIPSTAHTPPGFAGAVGTGFSLRVTADRTVVQLGEPIALTFELRGDGNLETASLPRLDAPGMLPASQFRVPEGELAGRLEAGAKKFSAMVRVVDSKVSEIPALAYAWFDPQTRKFQTTESRPIALSVRDAQVIGAAQVQREPALDTSDVPGAEPGATTSDAVAVAPRGPTVLTGADLAIERDVALLTRVGSGGRGTPGLVWGLYAMSMALLLLAFLDRRRRDVDPLLVDRRRRVSEHLRGVHAAESLPARDAASAIAASLRALIAERPEANTPEADALLGECDSRSYAPGSDRDRAPIDTALHRRAVELAERIAEGVG
ncbi:MAG: BatD family protein [Deltaproteobacteria bacterium]|nr:BatD family protein [Deltaproteobacteria bacterium]